MAISKNLYTRGLRQRLAGAVWYQRNGVTQVRELAASVSNPQTEAQMEQRTKLAELVQLYRVNSPWMNKYSFESKKDTWSDYNAFVSANLSASNVYLTKDIAEAGGGIVAPFIFTKGSLPAVNVQVSSADELFGTDLYTGSLLIDADNRNTITVAELTAALLDNNNGLRDGDQLSFIWNLQRTSAQGVPFVTSRYEELILDLSDNTPVSERIGENVIWASNEFTGNLNALCFSFQEGAEIQGALLAVSRQTTSGIKISTQTMVLSSDEFLNNYTGTAARTRAIRSYAQEVNTPFLSPGYQGGGTGDITTPISILSVSLTGGAQNVSSGGYLGSLPNTAGVKMTLNMSREITDDATVTFAVRGGYEFVGTGVRVTGNTITIDDVVEGNSSLSAPIILVSATVGGNVYRIGFAESEPPVTE